MIAIIAEKPSVAHEIAKIVGASQKQDGFLAGNGYAVTWAYGHLIELAAPAAYGYTSFGRENLPMLPTHSDTAFVKQERAKMPNRTKVPSSN